jgi:acyl carrier protein
MSASRSRDDLIRDLSRHIATHSDGKLSLADVDPEAEMCDRGYLDSLTYVSFLVFVEETYGVRILDHQLTGNLKTLSAVVDHVLGEKND